MNVFGTDAKRALALVVVLAGVTALSGCDSLPNLNPGILTGDRPQEPTREVQITVDGQTYSTFTTVTSSSVGGVAREETRTRIMLPGGGSVDCSGPAEGPACLALLRQQAAGGTSGPEGNDGAGAGHAD